MQLFRFAGGSAEPADVHGVLLLPLLHGGQSLHRAAQVNTQTHTHACVHRYEDKLNCKGSKQGFEMHFAVFSSGFMRSTACWLRLTTQHNRHGRTQNTWVSSTGGRARTHTQNVGAYC